jgi:hypothetical protein
VKGAKLMVREIKLSHKNWPITTRQLGKLAPCRKLHLSMCYGQRYRLASLTNCVQLTLQTSYRQSFEPHIDALPPHLRDLTVAEYLNFEPWLEDGPQHVTVTSVNIQYPFCPTDLGCLDHFPNLKCLQFTKVLRKNLYLLLCLMNDEIQLTRVVNLLRKWRSDNLRLEFTADEHCIFDWQNPKENHARSCVDFQAFLTNMIQADEKIKLSTNHA